MADDRIIGAVWDGEVFRPKRGPSLEWCRQIEPGENVALDIERQRDMVKHRGQFAKIKELWATLPECVSDAPYARSPETLRKHALISTGWCNVETHDCGTKSTAERLYPTLVRGAVVEHGYCIPQMRGPIIVITTPHSQSVRAMGGETFKRSRADVLRWIYELLEAAENEEAA